MFQGRGQMFPFGGSRPQPKPRTKGVTARSEQRRRYEDTSVLQSRYHVSNSMEQSREWYAEEVSAQLQRGRLFEDPFLPADYSSIDFPSKSRGSDFQWMRPKEVARDPKFVSDGLSRFDVVQGEIGDCWFLAAVASLSMYPDHLHQVVPQGQSFTAFQKDSKTVLSYCGMFWFRFWRFGKWIDVVIDDRLPTRNRRLVFMHSHDRDEFWSALLEKAYVKLVGSYGVMIGGVTCEAMEDFTGGLTEIVQLGSKTPPNFHKNLQRAVSRTTLMACSIDADAGQIEAKGPMGLICGHAYSVTDVRKVNTRSGSVHLVRLRNPWGNADEWYGPWSDQSSEWKAIAPEERKRIGLVFEDDGEFWMSFSDFVRYFSRVEFCYLGPETGDLNVSFDRSRSKRSWEATIEQSEWVRYSTAGGCLMNRDTFHTNPQFCVDVTDPDESDDDDQGTLIVGLMQKSSHGDRHALRTIGYAIYRVPDGMRTDQLLGRSFFQNNSSVATSPAFVNSREVCGRHRLRPGRYVVIPSTYKPNEEAAFMLRIFSERPYDSGEMDDSTKVTEEDMTTPAKLDNDLELTRRLQEAFNYVAGPFGFITSYELCDILNETFKKDDFLFDGFSRETARSMVALMDLDLNGKLNFLEFRRLWMNLRLWRTFFKKFYNSNTGTVNAFELRELLRAIGVLVSNLVYCAMVSRYANLNGEIPFDDFVLLLVRLVTVYETYKAQERLADGRAVFEIEDFVRSVIYI